LGAAGEGSAGKEDKRFSKSRQETKTIIDAEPDRAKKPRGLGLFQGEGMQFPDLARKHVTKVDVDQVPTVLHSLKRISIISGSSVGDQGKDARMQPIDFVVAGDVNTTGSGKGIAAQALTTKTIEAIKIQG